jgi:hypothetical protein
MKKPMLKTRLVLRAQTLRTLIDGDLGRAAAGQLDVNATAPPFSVRDATCVVAAVTLNGK